uniref:Uncharacterized protein n=1 Tax=Myotis myotis TaxID=51298 RepID=A0A7J7VYL0_MYOMY|nr:hypothetical protein mMyoMyo1_012268 [Myotis myotis]
MWSPIRMTNEKVRGNHRKPSLIGKLPGATLQGSSTRVQDEALWPKLAPRGCASTKTHGHLCQDLDQRIIALGKDCITYGKVNKPRSSSCSWVLACVLFAVFLFLRIYSSIHSFFLQVLSVLLIFYFYTFFLY